MSVTGICTGTAPMASSSGPIEAEKATILAPFQLSSVDRSRFAAIETPALKPIPRKTTSSNSAAKCSSQLARNACASSSEVEAVPGGTVSMAIGKSSGV